MIYYSACTFENGTFLFIFFPFSVRNILDAAPKYFRLAKMVGEAGEIRSDRKGESRSPGKRTFDEVTSFG